MFQTDERTEIKQSRGIINILTKSLTVSFPPSPSLPGTPLPENIGDCGVVFL